MLDTIAALLLAGTLAGSGRGWEPLPPELPLPAAPPNLAWTPAARIVQPWGASEHLAVADAATWAPRLAREFGFDTIILLPPAAHNAITAPAEHLTLAQFEEGLAAYRTNGFRFVLYSSLMHCGHDPAWQTGRLQREHPDWSQRDAKGNPITEYGAEWLCPNTGAFDHCLSYTLDLVRRYHADAVMLDNQEFLNSTAGLPTCYCDACRRRFHDYVAQRFGPDATRRIFGVALDQLTMPTSPGDLQRLWIHWRNRVWAEATARFRAALRAVRRDLVLLTNTAYEYGDWLLATDLQYPHEDAMLSESRGLTSRGMSAKLQLGQALARGRPLWNYLGTFREDDFTRLREPAEVEGMLAVSLARQARPWVVFYGFDEHPDENAAALERIARYVRFARDEPGPSQAGAPPRPLARVLSLLSLRARNYLRAPLHPPHQALLTAARVPFDTALETDLPRLDLSAFRVVVAEGTVCMNDAEIAALFAWVRAGGVLVASGDAAAGDELGRLRDTSPLRQSAGKGRVVTAETPEHVAQAVQAAAPVAVAAVEPAEAWEVVAYRPAAKRLLVHVVRHGPAAAGELVVRPPAGFRFVRAEWHAPGRQPAASTPTRAGGALRFALPTEAAYAILVVEAR